MEVAGNCALRPAKSMLYPATRALYRAKIAEKRETRKRPAAFFEFWAIGSGKSRRKAVGFTYM